MKRTTMLFTILFSLAIVGCGFSHNTIWGNGKSVTKSVNVDKFNVIDASNAFDIDVEVGEEQSLRIITDENIIEYVETYVKNDVLFLKMKDNYNYDGKVKAVISVQNLNGIDLSGACKIKIENISTDDFSIDVSGACKGSFSGNVKNLNLDLSGATKLDASNLKARNVFADISGASKLHLYCSEALEIDGSGASKVTISGNPKIQKTDFSGASSIYYK